jgi:hypothetical protein
MKKTIVIESLNKNLLMGFNSNSLSISDIKGSGLKFSSSAEQKIIVRTSDAVFEPHLLSKVKKNTVSIDEIKFSLSDSKKIFNAELKIKSSPKGIAFSAKINSKIPVWLFEWKLSGLEFDEVIVPALGGQSINNKMPEGSSLSYKYPFWWNAQFVVGTKKNGGLILRTEDEKSDLKLLRVGKENGKFFLVLGFESKAPLHKKESNAAWYLDAFNGSWKNAVDLHRTWMEKTFNLVDYKKHKHFPVWADDIKFVLELWGARKDNELPMHSFKQMIERIKNWKKLYNPKNTLLYLPGFAQHGIDSNAPNYNPSKQCGGEKDFKLLVDTAHKLGYKVMIHTNVLAMTFTHPLYDRFKKFQVVDVFDRPQGWAMDMDGDWLTEPFFAYMNPGYKEWGNLMSKILGDLISKFKIDGVFLDQTLLAFNESKGPDFVKGMREHIQRLQNDFPEILFAGEGLHEQNVCALPMAQIHGIDSIAEVHGMEGQSTWRKVHPVSSYLFGKYTKYTAHLLTKHPSHPMFKLQEDSYKKLRVIPALCLYNNFQKMNLPEVKKMIERSKKLR